METQKTKNFEVVSAPINGQRKQDSKLYMIVWERLANSGIMYCWADSEKDAFAYEGYNADYVKHTIVEINPESMPIEIGIAG